MNKKKPVYCPNKEYWFGHGEEAQAKPAGCRFKRGALLKPRQSRNPVFGVGYETVAAGKVVTLSPELRYIDTDSVLFLLDYNSEIVRRKVWIDSITIGRVSGKPMVQEWIEATQHTFTFLFGEKMGTLVLVTWGDGYKSLHNDMWHKARKPRQPPQKKPRKPPKGFSFDD